MPSPPAGLSSCQNRGYDFVLLDQGGSEVTRSIGVIHRTDAGRPVAIPFEHIGFDGRSRPGSMNPELRIIDRLEAAEAVVTSEGIREPENVGALLNTNYEEYVAVVIIGFRGPPPQITPSRPFVENITVRKLTQRESVIEIGAVLDNIVGAYTGRSPHHIIKIAKDKLAMKGKLTFILYDHLGSERARATAVVN